MGKLVEVLFFMLKDKENFEYEPDCTFKVDDQGFFIYWKSEKKVRHVRDFVVPGLFIIIVLILGRRCAGISHRV